MKLTEFEIIKRYFKQPFADLSQFSNKQNFDSQIDLSIGDDCAIIDCQSNQKIVTSTDQFIESIHFFQGLAPDLIAKKALIKALSDLMAMGAIPIGFSLALSTPKQTEQWFELFSKALVEIAKKYQIPLIGGDLASGSKIHLSIQVIGKIKSSNGSSKALLRSNLQVEDAIFVTGEIGACGYAINELTNGRKISNHLSQILNQPVIPVEFAYSISHLANSAIDVSDGLLQDIFHLINASQKGVRLDLFKIEQTVLDCELKAFINNHNNKKNQSQRNNLIKRWINLGDDYQLVFSCKKENIQKIETIAKNHQVKISQIGEVIQPLKMILQYQDLTEELSLKDLNDDQIKGYQHF